MSICKWTFIDNETRKWKSGCGREHHMVVHHTPIENGFKVCPYCGDRLAQSTAGYIRNYDHYYNPHYTANLRHLREIGEIE